MGLKNRASKSKQSGDSKITHLKSERNFVLFKCVSVLTNEISSADNAPVTKQQFYRRFHRVNNVFDAILTIEKSLKNFD